LSADQPITAEQAATLKRLAEAAYELETFQPNLTRAEADLRIAMLTAKLKLLDGPPHTLRQAHAAGSTRLAVGRLMVDYTTLHELWLYFEGFLSFSTNWSVFFQTNDKQKPNENQTNNKQTKPVSIVAKITQGCS